MIEYRVQIEWYNGFSEDYQVAGGPFTGEKEERRLEKFGKTLKWYKVTRLTPEEPVRVKKPTEAKKDRKLTKDQQKFIDKLYEIDARARENPVHIPSNKGLGGGTRSKETKPVRKRRNRVKVEDTKPTEAETPQPEQEEPKKKGRKKRVVVDSSADDNSGNLADFM